MEDHHIVVIDRGPGRRGSVDGSYGCTIRGGVGDDPIIRPYDEFIGATRSPYIFP